MKNTLQSMCMRRQEARYRSRLIVCAGTLLLPSGSFGRELSMLDGFACLTWQAIAAITIEGVPLYTRNR
jgi:hypothetical protein